jgi:hypothetical protein
MDFLSQEYWKGQSKDPIRKPHKEEIKVPLKEEKKEIKIPFKEERKMSMSISLMPEHTPTNKKRFIIF